MTVKVRDSNGSNVVEVHATGRLTHDDYAQFVPRTKRMIQDHGKIRVLFEMSDFHGWTTEALWDDIKFDLEHFKDIEMVAIVGDKAWERWMTAFCRPFTTAQVRYFDRGQILEARRWLEASPQARSA